MVEIRVGIDIGGSKMLLIAKGEGIEERHYLSTGKDFSTEDARIAISNWLERLPYLPKSIGIAIPGLVNDEGKVIACDVLPLIEGWSPALEFKGICRVLNDAEAALYEAIANRETLNAAIIMVGTGIGAAFQVDGRFLRGARGWAGELGSIPINCTDGMTLDGLASGAAILKRLGVNSDRLTALVSQSDPNALEVIRQAGSALGLGIATVINLFNLELIAIAGGTCKWSGYIDAALTSARASSLPDLWAACTIEPKIDAGDIVALGVMRAAD